MTEEFLTLGTLHWSHASSFMTGNEFNFGESGMKSLLNSTTLVLAALALAACGLVQSPTPGLDSETLRSDLDTL